MFSENNSNLEKLEQEIKMLKAQLEAEREKGATKDAIISEATRSLKENADRAIEVIKISISGIEHLSTMETARREKRGLDQLLSFGNEIPDPEHLREKIETLSGMIEENWETITKALPQPGKLKDASIEVLAGSRGQSSASR